MNYLVSALTPVDNSDQIRTLDFGGVCFVKDLPRDASAFLPFDDMAQTASQLAGRQFKSSTDGVSVHENDMLFIVHYIDHPVQMILQKFQVRLKS